jgi:hypothetical protein
MTKLFKLKRRLSTRIETDLLMILWFSFLGAAIVFTITIVRLLHIHGMGIDVFHIARTAGVCRATVYRYINRDVRSREICDRLRAMGVPQRPPYRFLKPERHDKK